MNYEQKLKEVRSNSDSDMYGQLIIDWEYHMSYPVYRQAWICSENLESLTPIVTDCCPLCDIKDIIDVAYDHDGAHLTIDESARAYLLAVILINMENSIPDTLYFMDVGQIIDWLDDSDKKLFFRGLRG